MVAKDALRRYLFGYCCDPQPFIPVFVGTIQAFDAHRMANLKELEADLVRTLNGSLQFPRLSLVMRLIDHNGIIDEERNPGRILFTISRSHSRATNPQSLAAV